jgi:hypothetical protein
VNVVSDELAEMLGYAPQADAMLQEVATGRRVWVELEVSRADPVANHAKFATAHLVSPMPQTDSFVSMVSRHVVRGRSNLAAHTVGLMRAIGIRAFQTPLLPNIDADDIKRLNHLPIDRLREEPLETFQELVRVMSVASILGRALESDIHFAANAVEVVFNIHRWNLDMKSPVLRERWRRRPVRYFAHDPRSGLFAPSKIRGLSADACFWLARARNWPKPHWDERCSLHGYRPATPSLRRQQSLATLGKQPGYEGNAHRESGCKNDR